jgi:hypothetical protein
LLPQALLAQLGGDGARGDDHDRRGSDWMPQLSRHAAPRRSGDAEAGWGVHGRGQVMNGLPARTNQPITKISAGKNIKLTTKQAFNENIRKPFCLL